MSTPSPTPDGLPAAPPVQLPPDPATLPVTPALRRVIALLFVNLGLSAVLTVLVFLFRDEVVDYQLAHMTLPPNANVAGVRQVLQQTVWSRVAGVLIVSLVYLFVAYRLRQGKRGAYRRVIMISIFGMVGIIYLLVAGNYPIWMRVEQVLQGLVLAALLWSVLRPEVRARFAKI